MSDLTPRLLDIPACAPHTPLDTARLYTALAQVPVISRRHITREGVWTRILRMADKTTLRKPRIVG